MNAARIIAEAAEAGVRVHAQGEKLRLVAASGSIPQDIIAAFRSCKGEVLALLQTRERLARVARVNGLPGELVQALADADVAACTPFPDTVLADYLRARHERYGLTVLQWRALSALREDPALVRARIGDDAPNGYRVAMALRRPDGRLVVGELVFSQPPPLRALLEAEGA